MRTHGKNSTYNYGCRCKLCIQAGKDHRKAYFSNPEKRAARVESQKRFEKKHEGYNARMTKRRKDERRKNRLCIECGANVVHLTTTRCSLCLAKARLEQNARRKGLK